MIASLDSTVVSSSGVLAVPSLTTLLSTTMESTALALCEKPEVAGVTIRSGRRVKSFGECSGEPRATWSLATNVHVEVWGDGAPDLDAILELARLVDLKEQEITELAEALTKAHDRQLRLFELTRLNADSLNRDRTVMRVLRHAIAMTEADDAVVCFPDKCVSSRSASDPSGWLSNCTTASVAAGNIRQPLVEGDQRALIVEFQLEGCAHYFAVGRVANQAFGTAERKILDALCDSLSGSLRLIALHESALRNAVVENEHATAASLTSSVLQPLPTVKHIDLDAATLPARDVGGDFFFAIKTDHGVRFVIGDVAGKGLPAAVLMTSAITSARYVFTHTADVEATAVDLLNDISDALESLLVATNRFITMAVGIAVPDPVSAHTIHLSVANAGHSPVAVVRGAVVEHVPPHCPPVGVGIRALNSGYSTILHNADRLVVGSDGLSEQENITGEPFGDRQLERLFSTPGSAAEVVQHLLSEIALHGGRQPRSDDQTFFVLQPSVAVVGDES
jgi:serine phosphatase RsbU (regulator of sigma subunit)